MQKVAHFETSKSRSRTGTTFIYYSPWGLLSERRSGFPPCREGGTAGPHVLGARNLEARVWSPRVAGSSRPRGAPQRLGAWGSHRFQAEVSGARCGRVTITNLIPITITITHKTTITITITINNAGTPGPSVAALGSTMLNLGDSQ